MTIPKDRVTSSLYSCRSNLSEILTAVVYSIYLTVSTIMFFIIITKSTFVRDQTSVTSSLNDQKLHSIIFLQIFLISQALIFIIRSHGLFFTERPSLILFVVLVFAHLLATAIAVYGNCSFIGVEGCGWSWAMIIWIWDVMWFLPLDFIKV